MMNKENRKLNNEGITLIEIIIVLAIMAIIGAATYMSLQMATNKQVVSCADKLRTSLDQTRNMALGKNSAYLKIWKDGAVYIQMYVDNDQYYGDEISIGVAGLDVTYDTNTTTGNVLGATPVIVQFDRSSGGVKGSPYVKSFTITNGNRTCVVTIDHFTGRISVT